MSVAIGIDLSCLEVQPETGVERYARRLVESLLIVAPELPLRVFVRPGRPAPFVRPPSSVVSVDSLLPRVAWRETALLSALGREGVGLLHSPVAAVPFRPSVPTIATIHDISRRGSGKSGWLSRNYLRLLHAMRSTRAMVVPSEATKRALLRLAPELESRVIVIPHGVDRDFRPDGVVLDRRRYGIPDGPFLLSLGTVRPRKDPLTLIRAFARLIADGGHDDLNLVLSGAVRMEDAVLRKPLQAIGQGHRLILTGYVAREDLPDLYRDSEVVVLPSKLEGFGLPALEAMACGKPLIVSRDPALLEVVGEGALNFEAGDELSLMERLREVLDDQGALEDQREAALRRARLFSWEASARSHAALYERILGS